MQRDAVAAGVLHDLGAGLLLRFRPTHDLNHIGLQPFLFCVGVVAVDHPAQRAPHQVDGDDSAGGDRRERQVSGGGQHTDRRRAPQRGGGVEAANVDALAQDHSTAQKPDTGHHIRGDSGGAGVLGGGGVQHEQGRARGDQRIGPQASPTCPPLPLESDQRPATNSDGQPEPEIGNTQRLHDIALLPPTARPRVRKAAANHVEVNTRWTLVKPVALWPRPRNLCAAG